MSLARRSFLGALSAAGSLQAAALPPRPQADSLEADLLEAIDEIPLVNTHEHITPEDERTSSNVDFFTLAGHYAINDVISAGLRGDDLKLVRDPNAPTRRRWEAFEPYWKAARLTGYGQVLRIAIRDIYDSEEISANTLDSINDRIEARNKPGLYDEILSHRSNIEYSVLDDYWNPAPVAPDPRFFALARKFDRFITPQSSEDIKKLEALTDVSITSLAGLKRAIERSFEQSLAAGMVTVKSTLAYNREIHYAEVPASAAEAGFADLIKDRRMIPQGFRARTERPYRELEDHMFHHLIGLADANDIPVQIHTGLHAGNGNFIENSKPTHLTNLFFLYPQVKFDLFHVSYPYQGEASAIAKVFPNVSIDFCWTHIISGSAARGTLHEMLEMLPANKIFGFGGDYRFPELTYAHAKIARANVAKVLSEKVEANFCNDTEALELARMLLHDNPDQMFGWRRRSQGI